MALLFYLTDSIAFLQVLELYLLPYKDRRWLLLGHGHHFPLRHS